MVVTQSYASPLGEMLLSADEAGVTGLWFAQQKYYARGLPPEAVPGETPVLAQARQWLNVYFSGRQPDFLPPLHPNGTDFQKAVWNLLLQIPYGKTMTYGEIARRLGKTMSAQAVGSAVGHNPISIIIPCHRVVGTNGSLTGYAGGIQRKIRLLELEEADVREFFVPKTGTAL